MPRSMWFPFVERVPADRGTAVVVCLPHAGAGASSYRAWGATAPTALSVLPVQPPGRETRVRQPPHLDVGAFVRDLLPALLEQLDGPFALYGHSTGAITAFEVARALRRAGAQQPCALFVSGRRAPDMPMPDTRTGGGDLLRLRQTLRRLGGTPPEVLENDRMLSCLQPVLEADFRLNEDYEYYEEDPLTVPITVFWADADPGAGEAETLGWGRQTAVTFNHVRLTGGHFAVLEQGAMVQQVMADQIARHRQAPGANREMEAH